MCRGEIGGQRPCASENGCAGRWAARRNARAGWGFPLERLCGLTAVLFLKEVEGLAAKPQVTLSQLEGFPKSERPVSPHSRQSGPHGRFGPARPFGPARTAVGSARLAQPFDRGPLRMAAPHAQPPVPPTLPSILPACAPFVSPYPSQRVAPSGSGDFLDASGREKRVDGVA